MSGVVDVVGEFASSAVDAVAGAAGDSLAGFLSTAGTMLAVAGALTGKKDLMRLGGFMALGGGLMSGFGSQAATESSSASSAWDAPESAAQSDQAQFGKYARDPIATTTDAPVPGQMPQLQDVAGTTDPWQTPASETPSLMDRAAQATRPVGGAAPAMDPVAQAGASMTSTDLNSYLAGAWDKTKSMLGGVSGWMQKNPELTKLGAGMLQGAFGPEAEMVDLRKQQAEWERSLLQRRLRNLNSPIALGQRPAPVPPVGG